MKKNIKKYLVVATIVALPLASISYAHTRTHETERRELIRQTFSGEDRKRLLAKLQDCKGRAFRYA